MMTCAQNGASLASPHIFSAISRWITNVLINADHADPILGADVDSPRYNILGSCWLSIKHLMPGIECLAHGENPSPPE